MSDTQGQLHVHAMEDTPNVALMDMEVHVLTMFIKRQVLSMRPIRKFQWALSETALSADDPLMQQSILDHIVNDAKVNKNPPSPLYIHSFLKHYIGIIEKKGQHEIADEIFERFTELMMTVPRRPEAGGPPLPPCFKSYALDKDCQKVVTVMEEQSTVGSGTTDNTLCPVTTCLLDWENFTMEQVANLAAQVVIMSDLTYDPTNIKPLVAILKAIFAQGVVGYMSSAVRNPKTFEDFFEAIRSECVNIGIQEIELDHANPLFFFDEETVQTVRVFEFRGH
ncbi:Protein fam86a [Actinomortierella ambigua]|uniref:Protein fam86a n=1 Tax=Actinomortierella ambigua TaxID=1343610 RepID=A0A9P6U446_9FUNG|nr:Protein fam86a [Actinomortierella ambigua]